MGATSAAVVILPNADGEPRVGGPHGLLAHLKRDPQVGAGAPRPVKAAAYDGLCKALGTG